MDPTKDLSRLISEHKYDEAFIIALQRSEVSIVSWLCSQVSIILSIPHSFVCDEMKLVCRWKLVFLVMKLVLAISSYLSFMRTWKMFSSSFSMGPF